jgi:hypothetical protein
MTVDVFDELVPESIREGEIGGQGEEIGGVSFEGHFLDTDMKETHSGRPCRIPPVLKSLFNRMVSLSNLEDLTNLN